MSASAATRVLQEPALLLLVLSQLSQQELLRVQGVCQTWNSLITTNTTLMTIMWLHPGIPNSLASNEATTQVNPLLQKAFHGIFQRGIIQDMFTIIPDRVTPFMEGRVGRGPKSLEKLKFPTASWRRMLPCFPAPDQLLVNVSGERGGKTVRLNFSNKNAKEFRPSHPPWLTFGMLYDITECAWVQANPWRLHGVIFEFPSASSPRKITELFPREAIISDALRASASSRAGRVRIHLDPDTRSEAERFRVHAEVVADMDRSRKRAVRYGWCGTNPRQIQLGTGNFTTEFHFADALSFDEIEWDEVDEYDMPPPPPLPSRPAPRRFLGIRIGKRT